MGICIAAAQSPSVAGAQLADDRDALSCIAAFSFLPDGTSTVYRKQYLHPGEELYARPGPMLPQRAHRSIWRGC